MLSKPLRGLRYRRMSADMGKKNEFSTTAALEGGGLGGKDVGLPEMA